MSQIYAAALHPEKWDAALGALARLANAAACHLVGLTKKNEVLFSFAFGLDPTLVAEARKSVGEDPWLESIRDAKPLDLCVDIPVKAGTKHQTHAFARLLADRGLCHSAGTALLRTSECDVVFFALRRQAQGPFRGDDIKTLSVVLPQLKQAIEIGLAFDSLRTVSALQWSAVQRMKLGVVAIEADGTVVLANDAARTMGDADDGLMLTEHGLQAQRRSDDQKLQQMIMKGFQAPARGESADVGHAELIGRRSGRPPYIVSVFRWILPDAIHYGRKPTVLAILRDPAATPPQSEEQIAELLGLTRAEARLAKQLVEGATLQAAAATLGISPNTARTQLRSIFRKTDTSRQAELLRLLTLSLGTSLR